MNPLRNAKSKKPVRKSESGSEKPVRKTARNFVTDVDEPYLLSKFFSNANPSLTQVVIFLLYYFIILLSFRFVLNVNFQNFFNFKV